MAKLDKQGHDSGSNRVLRIGLTGGIASGKSVVADFFADLGVPIIDTDQIARDVVEPGQPALAEIVSEFGADLLTAAGRLDRSALRERIFEHPAQRRRLESILHPVIRRRTLEMAESAGGPYQVIVVPLLIESGFIDLVDRVLVVDCPESMQRERLTARDDENPERVERILAAQIDRGERLKAADDVIDNGGGLEATKDQVSALHQGYIRQASQG